MAKYCRKPEVVEAEQFWPDKKPWPEGVYEETRPDHVGGYCIDTTPGLCCLKPGDWVIRRTEGVLFPTINASRPEFFVQNYEPVAAAKTEDLGSFKCPECGAETDRYEQEEGLRVEITTQTPAIWRLTVQQVEQVAAKEQEFPKHRMAPPRYDPTPRYCPYHKEPVRLNGYNRGRVCHACQERGRR